MMYRVYKEELTLNEIMPTLPPTPIIVIVGNSVVDAAEIFVCVENCIIAKSENFFTAILVVFSCFYVFNLEYPGSAAISYEFLQRYFAGIDLPCSKSPKKRKYNIHPKVLTLSRMLKKNTSL